MLIFAENQFMTRRMRIAHLVGTGLSAVMTGVLVLTWLLVADASDKSPLVARWWLPLIALVSLGTSLMLQIRIRVDTTQYCVQLWPWPIKTKIPVAEITAACIGTVRPFREFGGWGYRARPGRRLYSLGGRHGVTVEYQHKNKPRKLTVTTQQADGLLSALQKN